MRIVCKEICEHSPCVCFPNTPFCKSTTRQPRWFAVSEDYYLDEWQEREIRASMFGPNVTVDVTHSKMHFAEDDGHTSPTPTTHNNSLLPRGGGLRGGGDHRARARVDRERSASGQGNPRREPHDHGKEEPDDELDEWFGELPEEDWEPGGNRPLKCPRCGSKLREWADGKYAGVRCSVCSFVEAGEVG